MENENHLLIKSFRQTLISSHRNKKRQANPENKQTNEWGEGRGKVLFSTWVRKSGKLVGESDKSAN